MDKQEWLQQAENIINGYLTRQDGCFDDQMHATLVACDYEAQSVTIEFETQKWQINEWGGIHGGAIAGMFDTAFGVVADFIAGENEATNGRHEYFLCAPAGLRSAYRSHRLYG